MEFKLATDSSSNARDLPASKDPELSDGGHIDASGGQGVQVGDNNRQVNIFYGAQGAGISSAGLSKQDLDWVETRSAVVSGDRTVPASGWRLASDPVAARHWLPRSRGVAVDSERGYRFRGRSGALTKIVDWLDRPAPDRKVLVVTGSPGAGKSAVLGRIVTTADGSFRKLLPSDDKAVRATPDSVACAVHARSMTALDVAVEIARAASGDLPDEPGDLAPLLRRVLEHSRPSRFNVVIDALDEAASPGQVREIITKVVLPMVETCSDIGVQVVVGTRTSDDSGSVLAAFGRARTIIDLDDPEYFDREDLGAYALACLQLAGDDRPASPYSDHDIASRVARKIAEIAERNFLVAGLVARDHGMHDETAVDPLQITFDPSIETALIGYLNRVGSVGGLSAIDALTVLAFAEAPGLSASMWQLLTGGLHGQEVSARILLVFARSAAASFLIETHVGDSGEPVFQLYHQALADSLLSARARIIRRLEDERSIASILLDYGRKRAWRDVAYVLRSLPRHAAAAGVLDELLTDDSYLLNADLQRLTLASQQHPATAESQRALKLIGLTPEASSAKSSARAALFSVTQALEGAAITYGGIMDAPYLARWASSHPIGATAVLQDEMDSILAMCSVKVDGRDLLASGGISQDIRIWDPITGRPALTLKHDYGWVQALCDLSEAGEETNRIASAASDGIRIWDSKHGGQVRLLPNVQGSIRALSAVSVNGRTHLASGGDDKTIRIWDLSTGEETATLTGHEDRVKVVCRAGGSLLTSSDWHSVRVWDAATGEQIHLLQDHKDGILAVCPLAIASQTLIATAETDGIHLWDPADGRRVAAIPTHWSLLDTLCSVVLDGIAHLVGISAGGTINIWDPSTGNPIKLIEAAHSRSTPPCIVIVRSRPHLAIAADDNTIKLWDLSASLQRSRVTVDTGNKVGYADLSRSPAPLGLGAGHGTVTGPQLDPSSLPRNERNVKALCPVLADSQVSLASAHDDGRIRIWDPASGKQKFLMPGHHSGVNAMCQITLNGKAALATVGNDGEIRTWDLDAASQSGAASVRPISAHTIYPISVDNRSKLIAFDYRGSPIWIGDPLAQEDPQVIRVDDLRAACPIEINGSNFLACSAQDGRVYFLDLVTGDRRSETFGPPAGATIMIPISSGSDSLLAAAESGGTKWIYDLMRSQFPNVLAGHNGRVNALSAAEFNGHMLLASAGNDQIVRIWNLSGARVTTIPVRSAALAVTWTDQKLAIGTRAGLLVIEPNIEFLTSG